MAKAASQLALSEPAVSRSISDMEHTLGVSLFDRSSKGVEPTPYGRVLIKRGVAIFDELRQGIREIDTIKDPTIGEVHIGATSTIAEVGIVAAVIAQMSQKYPCINFHVVEATPEWLFHELRERSLDLIILLRFDPVASNDIVSEMLYEDRIVIVAAADNPWSRQSRVELVDLVDENWTLPEPEHPVTSIVASAFRAIGCEAPRVTATAAPGRYRLHGALPTSPDGPKPSGEDGRDSSPHQRRNGLAAFTLRLPKVGGVPGAVPECCGAWGAMT
jgi:DNA-binding transcriptional LysR family regulator